MAISAVKSSWGHFWSVVILRTWNTAVLTESFCIHFSYLFNGSLVSAFLLHCEVKDSYWRFTSRFNCTVGFSKLTSRLFVEILRLAFYNRVCFL